MTPKTFTRYLLEYNAYLKKVVTPKENGMDISISYILTENDPGEDLITPEELNKSCPEEYDKLAQFMEEIMKINLKNKQECSSCT